MKLRKRKKSKPAQAAEAVGNLPKWLLAIPVVGGLAAAMAAKRRKAATATDLQPATEPFGGVNDGAESHQPPVQAAASPSSSVAES